MVAGSNHLAGVLFTPLLWTVATVYESRPSWIPTIHRWLRTPVAQFRLDPHRKTWTLYRADRAGRWFVLEEIPPSPDVSELLNRLHLGPSGIFFR
ncbi:DUF3024 domain-containing protein [Symbiobacterium thermophilum]|uniref:DUF3024 domain-containing protein n=1 Tax=Symbiobacterium thermophilum TaxID=2734 RepID=UPI000A07504C